MTEQTIHHPPTASQAAGSVPSNAPIFILGVTARSGTNFLHDLLCLHPDCGAPVPGEDFLVMHADLLAGYVSAVSSHWVPGWGADPRLLQQSISDGLTNFLRHNVERPRLVTKTPNVTNIQHFFQVFTDARLLILMRDGRSVVESWLNSFSANFDTVTRGWARAARTVQGFRRQHAAEEGRRFMLVRYEDIYLDTEAEVRLILDFAGLDPARYDFASACNLPVRGSSVLRGGSEKVHWNAVPREPGFNPLERWRGWNRERHERFNWLAGEQLEAFGYQPQRYKGPRLPWALRNRAGDVSGRLQAAGRRLGIAPASPSRKPRR